MVFGTNLYDLIARAVCCVQGDEGKRGSNNFDLCDNMFDYNSGKVLLDSIKKGVIGDFGKQG